MTIDYGPSRQRIVQKTFQNNVLKEKKIYVSSLYEKEVTDTTMREMVYIRGAGGVVAVENKRTLLSTNAVTNYTDYWHKDHLGSLQSVTNSSGQKVAEYNYDAWGKRRNLDGSAMPITFALNGNRYDRGFTGHEHIDLFGLINMNGRVYDPVLGRFLSPDPVFEDIGDYQSMNRYSYVRNNPLNFTDPSGFKSWRKSSIGRAISKSIKTSVNSAKKSVGYAMSAGKSFASGNFKEGLRQMGKLALSPLEEAYNQFGVINELGSHAFGAKNWSTGMNIAIQVAGAVVSYYCGPVIGGAFQGFASAAFAASMSGGSFSDAMKSGMKAAAIGALMGAATYCVGSLAEPFMQSSNYLAAAAIKGVGHGVIQGVYQEATGGSFKEGFISGAATGAFEGLAGGFMKANNLDSYSAKVVAGALVGGTSASISGGDFTNGAMTGAFVAMYNAGQDHSNASGIWGKLECGWSTKGTISVNNMGEISAKGKYKYLNYSSNGQNIDVNVQVPLGNPIIKGGAGYNTGGGIYAIISAEVPSVPVSVSCRYFPPSPDTDTKPIYDPYYDGYKGGGGSGHRW
jgi:RHS repeat-associated protein